MEKNKKEQDLKGISFLATFFAAISWAMWGLLFSILSIGAIIWGFIEYKRNGGPKLHFYMLFVAILLLLLKIPFYYFVSGLLA